MGPQPAPVEPQPHQAEVVSAEPTAGLPDNNTRSQNNVQKAIEAYEEGRLRDAARYSLKAYRVQDQADKFEATGLAVLIKAVTYHFDAYEQTRDVGYMIAIHPELERFLLEHQGVGPEVDKLQRQLVRVRSNRLGGAAMLHQRRQYKKAGREAADCFRALAPAAKGEQIGERAALAASRAYRQAWYGDNDIRHLQVAIELVQEHLDAAAGGASRAAKKERRHLAGRLEVARAGGGAIDDGGDASDIRVVTQRDRSFMMAAGAGLGAGVVLSLGAGLTGGWAFQSPMPRVTEDSLVARPEHVGPAVMMSVVGAAASGLAIHSMIDAGFVAPRERKIIAASGIAVGLLGSAVGTTLLIFGTAGEATRRRTPPSNAGLGLLLGMSAPLSLGLSALLSRRGG